ncbi:MAG TPA: TetR/AcrR family transcriptional regulator [Acidimicrobiales bacterium]|nr:TetR/AcrR family transcriptional regulator [Acidimicrobiales bacterium]
MEPARTRREEYAEATYEALLESAAACFLESGFAATSLDAVARRARVTKGAIYHHFASKRDLFMAVLDRQEEVSARTVTQAATAAADPWTAMVAAFDAFLETIADPVYQRLCFVEGPAALGFEDWWACGERYEIEVIRTQLDRAAQAGVLVVEDLDMLAHVLFGAVTAGVLAMARAADPEGERDRFRTVMLKVMAGMVRMDEFKPPWGGGAA